MTKLLYVKASPRIGSSAIKIADAYLAALKRKDMSLEIDTLDPWNANLPEFDGNKANAKLAVIYGQTNEGAQAERWAEVTAVSKRFIAADRYLFAVPMWNGGIPYKLKQYIDIVHQPALTFGLDPAKGYFGLLHGKKATVVYTSGAYAPSMPSPAYGIDHQSTYMTAWLNQAGIMDIEEIRFQPTVLTADGEGDLARVIADAESRAA